MSDFLDKISQYSPKRLALLADDLQRRLTTLEAKASEPIAIVGIGCRLPGGAETPDKLWDLLQSGTDAVVEVPTERWSLDDLYDPDADAPGKMSTRWGGFLKEVDRFDPHFFGISPREAHSMDPQQRLLLEVAWEALEHAGISPQGVEGSRTGVFLGVSASDYYQVLRADGVEGFDAYTASGVAHSIASGRLSYVLGARGPSISIDTACSSSLVAIHMAVQSLRRDECTMALAGGVNLILGPDITIALSRARMMAPDGRCKAFDAKADGFVRGEGCGMLVLKRLSHAQADGDRIIAVIRGSASNQDGRSNGLIAPNGPSQEEVIRDALANARVAPAEVSVVEAHGTGTSLGDPIEIQALAAAYGADRAEPLIVGSVKANLGHLEAAAGVTGVIKMAMALQHGKFPPQLHFHEPNPHIAWDALPVTVAADGATLPVGSRLGAVSSFGFSGTNVHMVLEQAPESTAVAAVVPERAIHLLTASARDEAVLREIAAARRNELASGTATFADVAHTSNAGRAHFSQRLALTAANSTEAIAQLDAFLAGQEIAGVRTGKAPARSPKIGFLFTGQGAQYAGMARTLYETHPVFREALDRCDAILGEKLPQRLLSVIYPPAGGADLIDSTEYTQPALFAVEYALVQLWASWGVRPSMVMGHSVGEYVAACIAGVLSLEDSLSLITERGRLMGALPRDGAMAAVMADPSHVEQALTPYRGEVSIAAVNGPRNVVISGRERAVVALLARFEAEGVSATRLKVSHAFHSPLMAPIADALQKVASGLTFAPPSIDLVSNLTGGIASASTLNAQYWREQLLAPVQFASGIGAMIAADCTTFLEIGPHPTLVGMGRQCAPDARAAWAPSLRRGADDWRQLLDAAAALYVEGVKIDWRGFDAPWPRRRVTLASYPFQRSRYWVDPIQPVVPASRARPLTRPVDDLPPQVRSMLHEVVWQEAPGNAAGLLDPASVSGVVEPLLSSLVKENQLDAYGDFAVGLDQLASRYIVRALADLGFTLREADRFDAEDLRMRLGVLDRHGRLFHRMLDILAEDGVLESANGMWRVVKDDASGEPEPLADALLAQHADCVAELTLTCRCARSLAAVLRGEDPLPLLFPEGSLADTEKLYQVSPPARTYNTLIASAVAAALRDWPMDRPLRVLEIGAGTGSTTSYVLPALVARGAALDYTFTDIGKVFLQRARDKFADQPGMHYATLDITRDPAPQGFVAGGYDIVLAANVLHATPDLAVTVGNVRKLMAPGGMLILLEGSTTQRFGDLTVGMLGGWWAYTDTDRREYALMPKAAWRQLLEEQGFSNAVAVPATTGHPVLLQQAVLLAQAPAAASAADPAPARWLIVPDAGGASAALAAKLTARGDMVRIAPTAPALRGWLTDALREPWDGVVHMAGLDAVLDDGVSVAALEAGQERAVGSALVIAQTLAAQTRSAPKLWFVTRGAQAACAGEASEAGQATIWGLSHVVALEHPELHCRRIDLDPVLSADAAADALVAEFASAGHEDQVALRSGRRLVRRLAPYEFRPTVTTPMKLDPERSYLITGGLRGLGLRVAEWMVEQGARHLALMGRHGPDDRAEATLERLRQAGADVLVITGDVSSAPDVTRAFAEIEAALPPLAGVIHSAGTLADAVLGKQSWSGFATVFGPKVSGTWLLHTLAPKLDFLVLFSSGASLAGSGGQANHAAANAFEDAMAWRRQAQGLPTVSINWGPWAEIGAAADRKLDSPGSLRSIKPADGLAALAFAMRRDTDTGLLHNSQLAVLNTDWSHLSGAAGERTPLFSSAGAPSGMAAPISPPQRPLRERIAIAPPTRRRIVLRDHVRWQTAKVLGLARAEDIDVNEPLGQLGLDSL
ncbi:MAG: type I polyketide synthase, partial [Alphaproteobacteria bacterium]